MSVAKVVNINGQFYVKQKPAKSEQGGEEKLIPCSSKAEAKALAKKIKKGQISPEEINALSQATLKEGEGAKLDVKA